MFTSQTARTMAALGVLTITFAAIESVFGKGVGLALTGSFAFLWFVRNSDLWVYLARPFEWASGLLQGETA